ncbi:hypothetical protein B0H10DRAFT_2031192 [Mycena sp. CBHHK59/15]|nr:hypothetical protein B0H10DRAFT_2031192 [Mycena sp. CBHHK59/15]
MITILGSSDTEDTPSRASSKVTARPVRKHRTSIKPEPSSKIPALSLGNAQTPKLKIKNELSSSSFTPDVAADVKGLPAFIAKTWTTRFLPAAYRALHRSDDPMALGTVGRDIKNPGQVTVAVLQLVLDEVYPGNTWEIKWGDPICAKAVSCLGERWLAIGRAALQAVDRAFEVAKYYGALDSPTPGVRNTEAIKSDALYAVQRNGPAFWKHPTPKSCMLHPKDPEYIRETGYLESRLIIAVLTQFIKDDEFPVIRSQATDGVVDDFSALPKGALGMVAAVVIRVAQDKVPGFSSVNYGTAVAGFISGIRSGWISIIENCGGQITECATKVTVAECLDGIWEQMYIPSSP